MGKIKVLSKVYSNHKIRFGQEIIEFKNGVVEVSEDVYNAIVKSKFPNVYSEKEGIPVEKNFTEVDANKILSEAKEDFESEIARLKNIIKTKDDNIKQLKEENKTWKKEVEKLKAGKVADEPKATKTAATKTKKEQEEANEIEKLKEDLEKMSLEELKSLAIDEGMEESDVVKFEEKSGMIDALISFYNGK